MTFAENLRATGKSRGLALSQTVEFAFRRRYNLPPTDRRFLSATFEEMYLDLLAHRHVDDPKWRAEMMTDNFEAELEAFARTAPSPEENPDEWETVVDEKY